MARGFSDPSKDPRRVVNNIFQFASFGSGMHSKYCHVFACKALDRKIDQLERYERLLHELLDLVCWPVSSL